MRAVRLSATADSDFQGCQRRYLLRYICDLESTKDKDSLRIGDVWHKCHELIEMKAGAVCPKCQKREEIRPDCYICGGAGLIPEDRMESVARFLNYRYAAVPENKTAEEWEVERVQLLYSLSGHRWRWAGEGQRYEVIGSELKFEVPVINPETGHKYPKSVFVIKIDQLLRDTETGRVYVGERKSTSKDLGDTDYWFNLMYGDQVGGYLYGIRYAQAAGKLKKYGIKPDDAPVAGALLDVWHKPDIKPKTLSQADTAAFIESGEYYGQAFEVVVEPAHDDVMPDPANVSINGMNALITPGKRGFAIRETPEMYGARLLADIAERPDHYFARREVSHTEQELEQLQRRLFNLARQIRAVDNKNLWVANRMACKVPFWCEFRDLCGAIGYEAVPGPEGPPLPTGYRYRHQQEEVNING